PQGGTGETIGRGGRPPARPEGEPRPVLASCADQRLRGRDGRAGAGRGPADRPAGGRPGVENRDRLVHRDLRLDQGAAQPGGRRARVGRKPILVAGWLLGLPVPFMIMWAPSWAWINVANVLLGANQAFAWSMTVIMKVDLVGPQRRGLALGLNEFAGYLSVA